METDKGRGLAALLVLTLGFGALAAVLVVDKAVFFDPLPFKSPAGLVSLQGVFDQKGDIQDWGISHIDFLDWRQQNQVFAQMAAFSPGEMAFNLIAGKESERLSGELVSYTYFPVLGIKPAAGRFFTAEEDGKPFTHPVAVLSYSLWQRHFGGDPGAVGKTLDLNGEPYRVVGVAQEGFRGLSDKADAWIPSSMPPGPTFVANRRMRWLGGVARLKPGVTPEQAQADLTRITSALAAKYPDMNEGMGVVVRPFQSFWSGALRDDLRLLTLGAGLVFLLACLNAAVLLRGRAGLARSLLLSLAAAGLGLALAAWALRVLVPRSGVIFPSFLRLSVGPTAILIVLALAAALGFVLSLLRGRFAAGSRIVAGLQVALALVLLVTAGLKATDYRRAVSQDLGFKTAGLLTLRVDLQGPKYEKDPQVIDAIRVYRERLPKVPGVAELAIGGPTIPTDPWAGGYITIEDHPSDTPDGMYPIMTHGVSPDYFKVLGVPILQGRVFTAEEAGAPGTPYGVVVSKEMAEQQWPGQNPLGKHLKFGARKNPVHPMLTVIGVAGNVVHEGLLAEKRPAPDLYLPILQSPVRLPTTLNILARPRKGVTPESLVPALEREMQAIASDSPPYDAATMEERIRLQTQGGRFRVLLVSLFAALALVLAAVAVYNMRLEKSPGLRPRVAL